MLAAIVRVSLANPRTLATLALLLSVLGAASLTRAHFDVFPDFAPPHVFIQTEAPGLDASQVEGLVTRPLESVLGGGADVKTVRSTSSQGLSVVQVIFASRGDPYRQRQVIAERLSEVLPLLPEGVHAPQLSPLSSSVEYLLHFGFTSTTLSPLELRDIVQWSVKPQILAVPGVAQVQIFGGEVRERQVVVDPRKLAALDVGFEDVVAAVRGSTQLSGGGYVESASQRIVIRPQSPGIVPAALAQALVLTRSGMPIRLTDVATIQDGPEPRFGEALIDGKPGLLVETATQFGANTLEVSRLLEQRLNEVAPALRAQGVDYHPALLRPASFIEDAVRELRDSTAIGAVLVVSLLLGALRDWRAALVSFSAIPLSLLVAAWILEIAGLSLNTMTIGGLVVALGVVVDDAVIDVENILRRRRNATREADVGSLIMAASLEVRRPVFFATMAVVVAFIPILLLSGLQGAFFAPLSIAFLLAVAVSLLVAMSVTPALCVLVMSRHSPVQEAPLLQRMKRFQHHTVAWLTERPRLAWAILAATAVAGIAVLPLLGARLLPDFRESYLIVHTTLRPGVSIDETVRMDERISRRLAAIPGVGSVATQIGRAENGQDPDTPNKSEFEVQVDPATGRTAVEQIRKVFQDFPDQLSEINSMLTERIGETLSGDAAPFLVSVFGTDLEADDAVAQQVARVLRGLPGSGEVRLLVPARQPEIQVALKPQALSSHGLQAAEVLGAVSASFSGSPVSEISLADRSIPVVIRTPVPAATPQAVGELLLRGRDGNLVRLSSVADVELIDGRALLNHEGGLRRQVVVASPSGKDQVAFGTAARAAIATGVQPPRGVYLAFGGSAVEQAGALRELLLHSAAAIVLIVVLLSIAFGRARQVLLVILALPSTLIGGAAALALADASLTIGAMVGFVALFGMAARNSILLVSHYDYLVRYEGQGWGRLAALRGAEERFTPVLLTAMLTALALLPVALQSGKPGHEIEGPMAIAILGGLVSSTLTTLFIIPALSVRWLGKAAT
ncbi:MAG TPA: efflux RND transporter permease subunit [Steroidobacteraceae bacterium]|jgi:CzcA family heavy metal efflux pump